MNFIQADDLRLTSTGLAVSGSGLNSLPASSITVSPVGNISSTDVQSAIQELDSEKQPQLTIGNLTSSTSGVTIGNGTGAVIGSGATVNIATAGASSDGILTSGHWDIFNNKQPAITGTGFVKASGSTISFDNSTYEPSFSKNTAFNKNFGTTTGTVLEGRTFGTSANSAVGDFIQNQNSSVQIASQRISGPIILENAYPYLKLRNTTYGGNVFFQTGVTEDASAGGNYTNLYNPTGQGFSIVRGGIVDFSLNNTTGVASFSSTVNSTGFLLNGNNLTSSLTTNYIPKWNGSSFVNSLISDLAGNITVNLDAVDGRGLYVYSAGANNDPYIKIGRSGGLTDVFNIGVRGGTGNNAMLSLFGQSGSSTGLHLMGNGDVKILTATPSTLPTNGALVVNGGVGAAHVRANNFYGSGSNLTGVQLPITLTTNGTSGAATFSGNVLNVPNYASSGGVDQTLTTVNGSTSGNIVGSMPFQTANYKKVIVYVNFVSGNATYTFPTPFNTEWNLHTNTLGASYSSVSVSGTSVTITGATNAAGVLIIEGY